MKVGASVQSGQRAFGLVLLIDRDADHDDDEGHQHRAVQRLGEHEVHRAGAEEQQQHRLTDHRPGFLQQVAPHRCRKLIRPVSREPARRLLNR